MDWEHLRYFAAVGQHGSLSAAARVLQVEHSTVARRIQALEKSLGQALFTRESGGLRPSEAGRALLPAVEAMALAARGIERSVDQAGTSAEGPSGLVRVGTTEGLGTSLLAAKLAALTCRHAQLSVDLLALPRLLHLSRREADIVISLERPKRGAVIVSRLADYDLYLYGEREYLARRPLVRETADLRHHAFVHYVDDLLFTKELQLIDSLYQPQRYAFRSTSITAQYEAVRAGAGLGVLPAFLADRDPRLARVHQPQARFTRTFWMSMPQEGQSVPRIQAVWRWLKETLRDEAQRLQPGNVERGN